MANKSIAAQQSYNAKWEKFELMAKQLVSERNSRKKNHSFCSSEYPMSPDKSSAYNSINYFSDNASSYVQSSTAAKKYRANRSLSSSPTLASHYAGAKFSEPPEPNVLPLPPTHWMIVEPSSSSLPADIQRRSSSVTPVSSICRSFTPVENIESMETNLSASCTSTPLPSKPIAAVPMNQSVELFFHKCSFGQWDNSLDFSGQLKTLLNVTA